MLPSSRHLTISDILIRVNDNFYTVIERYWNKIRLKTQLTWLDKRYL